ALSGAEIETMATTSPWLETDLNYGYSDGYLGRIFADWYYKEPIPRVEGIYAIDLWAVDGVNNASYIPNAWIGSIDMIGPRITLTITEISDYVSQITCEATDFNLDDTTFGCPATGDATFSYQDADWFTQVASDTNKLYRLSNDTQNKMVVGDYSFTACDLFDNCTTFTE
ncbi:MAG: hypothetical protein GY832_41350, partial [Chloroflexi bacterium]|nr:hypothetical protein [Chloroflexota bacterium]